MAQKQSHEALRVQHGDTTAEKLSPRRGRVRPKERTEIIAASAMGKSRRQIAKEFRRSPNTIQAVLRRQDGRAMKADFQKTLREEIRSLLILGAPMAAQSWRRAVKNAAAGKRTNYQAARDWLLAAGVIQPLSRKKTTGEEPTIVVVDHNKTPGEDALTS